MVVQSVSEPYPDRGRSVLVRVYIEAIPARWTMSPPASMRLTRTAPATARASSSSRRDVIRESTMTDELAEELLLQIVALEEIVAARWPRSMILPGPGCGRILRASIRHVDGRTFADRRINALGTGWLERRP